jgi:DNA-binding NarL/FixJ family response regulator
MTQVSRVHLTDGHDPLMRPSANELKTTHYSLSERELDVLYLMQEGLYDQDIAYRLGVSKDAVSDRVGVIVEKMGVRSRTEAALRAFKECIFQPDS